VPKVDFKRIQIFNLFLPTDLIGYLLCKVSIQTDTLKMLSFTKKANKLVNWGIKSLYITRSNYFAFSFSILFCLFQYKEHTNLLTKLMEFLFEEYLPLYVNEFYKIDFNDIFELAPIKKEK
jgi:hypothetical protein